jgi:hypothetical protein
MTKKKEQTTPANTQVEAELERLLLDVLKQANGDLPLDAKIEAMNSATKTYATLRKLPPSGDERKGGFDAFRKQAAGGGTGGNAGPSDNTPRLFDSIAARGPASRTLS